jgi:ribosomal-protein-alanine N-acetyltransferase
MAANPPPELETARLVLRRWRANDLAPVAALNADPEVMEYFAATLSQEESRAMIARMEAKFEAQGFGFWAMERKSDGALLGMTGLNRPDLKVPFAPCVEIGWRLAREYWGQGYAPEAARAALALAFGPLGEKEVVAFTARGNERSRTVMRKLGMTHDPADDFEHPSVPEGHPLRLHVLYRIRA